MKIFGLTGGIGTGKSTAANHLKQRGIASEANGTVVFGHDEAQWQQLRKGADGYE